ncbi:hypothetical protein [Flavobacterium sp.]|uniref:hypothetical protein n=1 Tax=Flavobacterium sp. TaxID=239 RepID=UPI003A94FEE8
MKKTLLLYFLFFSLNLLVAYILFSFSGYFTIIQTQLDDSLKVNLVLVCFPLVVTLISYFIVRFLGKGNHLVNLPYYLFFWGMILYYFLGNTTLYPDMILNRLYKAFLFSLVFYAIAGSIVYIKQKGWLKQDVITTLLIIVFVLLVNTQFSTAYYKSALLVSLLWFNTMYSMTNLPETEKQNE